MGVRKDRALEEVDLHSVLEGADCANVAGRGPDRRVPLPILFDSRVCRVDHASQPGQQLTPPVVQAGDVLVDQFRRLWTHTGSKALRRQTG